MCVIDIVINMLDKNDLIEDVENEEELLVDKINENDAFIIVDHPNAECINIHGLLVSYEAIRTISNNINKPFIQMYCHPGILTKKKVVN